MADPPGSRVGVNIAAIPTPGNTPQSYLFNEDRTPRKLIVDVWSENLQEEFKKIRELILTHPYVAMDTEFPGVVWRVRTENPMHYQYQNLCANVNMLKIIQLGLTFSDAAGNLPPTGPSTWQFNFRFVLSEDAYAEDSILLLQQSGIDFTAFERRGVDPQHFAELMLTSGLCLNERITWLSFHSGFDFGYLIRMLTGRDLPESETEFHKLLVTLFGNVLDTKYLLKQTSGLTHTVGLTVLADDLSVLRIGPAHQAGSDSLLTWATYFKLVHDFFGGTLEEESFKNVLFGLGVDTSPAPQAVLNSITTGATLQARNINGPGVQQQPQPPMRAPQMSDPPAAAAADAATAQQLLRDGPGVQRGAVISERPNTPPGARSSHVMMDRIVGHGRARGR